jgi:5-methylcytosine-specific restriction endonuclease McrA
MLKKGVVREDGKVFLRYNKKSKNGEYWVTINQFVESMGADWFKKRAVMDTNVAEREKTKARIKEENAERAKTKDERDRVNKEKRREKNRKYQEKRRKENPKEKQNIDREYRLKNKDNDEYIQRRKKNQLRYYLKKNESKIKARKEARLAKAVKHEAERVEKIKRLVEKTEKKEETALAKSLRPKRVVLTEQQRLEAKRQEKRNYKHRRRARLRGLESKATASQIRNAKAKTKGKCFYCSVRVKMLTIDHILPICLGGSHTLDNIVFACHPCNSRKSGTHPDTFGKEFGLLLV